MFWYEKRKKRSMDDLTIQKWLLELEGLTMMIGKHFLVMRWLLLVNKEDVVLQIDLNESVILSPRMAFDAQQRAKYEENSILTKFLFYQNWEIDQFVDLANDQWFNASTNAVES